MGYKCLESGLKSKQEETTNAAHELSSFPKYEGTFYCTEAHTCSQGKKYNDGKCNSAVL
jgi:hypothetical protein